MILTGKEAAAMIDISAVRTHHGYSDIEEIVHLQKSTGLSMCMYFLAG